MTAETWRVVTESGAIGSLEVRAEAGGWHDVGGRQYHPLTPLRAAIAHAAWERDWAVAEILAPGELTRAEAAAAMRERCALECDAIANDPESRIEEARSADHCAEAIRALLTTGGEGR